MALLLLTERPSMAETTALGAAIAAGSASQVNVWKVDKNETSALTMETFKPSVSEYGKSIGIL